MTYVGYKPEPQQLPGVQPSPSGPSWNMQAPSQYMTDAMGNMSTLQPAAVQGSPGQQNPQLQAILDLFNSAVMGPTEAIGNQQIGNLQDQMMLTRAGGDLQSQLAQQQAGFSQQGLGLQRQQLGIREDALAREMGLLPQQYGLQQQGFGLQEAEASYGAGQSRRALDSSATARGSFTSEGANQGRADISQQLQFALQGIGLQRGQAALSNQEQMAQLQDSKKMLGISSQQLGLSDTEVKARLQNALDQIGISSQMTTDQLLSEMYKIQQGEISPISGLIGDIYQLSGISLPTSNLPDNSTWSTKRGTQ